MTTEDIRLEGRSERLGMMMTSLVVDGQNGKKYRIPTAFELETAASFIHDTEKQDELLKSIWKHP